MVGRSVLDVVVDQSRRVLETYRVDPGLIVEHSNNERRIAQGGYGDRQIYELVQNAADEVRACPDGGEIAVVLTSKYLYCANEGSPVTAEGADTILRMSVSRKRGGQIGRFGVGVKSVLAISDGPEFLSRDETGVIGFGFDRHWSAAEIRKLHPDVRETPVLRMARPLDVALLRATDLVLAELMTWATTVVRLPLKPESVLNLARDLEQFPVEFPLFSPHVRTVTLEDRRGQTTRRQIRQWPIDHRRTLQEFKVEDHSVDHRWRVFSTVHRPTAAALAAAGELHDRPEIDISWAVPETSGTRGTFWAYFPTKFATTLRGILNAPWKTSEDRQAIFDGNAFNNELLAVAAELVVDSLPDLSTPEDPACYIDFLPGRGREAPQFADERLTNEIWKAAAVKPSLVDQAGRIRSAAELHLHPEDLRNEWLRLWGDHPGRPDDWVHHSAERRERRARVVSILGRVGRQVSTVREWLEALVVDGTPEASAAAIRIAAGLAETQHQLSGEALHAHVVLTEDGRWVPPTRGAVFRRSQHDALADDLSYVSERVVEAFGVTSALDVLGIREADTVGRFAAVVDRGFAGYTDDQWIDFWELARAAGPIEASDVLGGLAPADRGMINVLTTSGLLRPVSGCLLPGQVVPGDGSRDGEVAVDMRFHTDDREVLELLGLSDRPVPQRDPEEDPVLYDEYVEFAWDLYCGTLGDTERRPQKHTMRIEGADPVGPLRFLRLLSPEGRAAFLANLPPRGGVQHWTVQVGKQRRTRITVSSPLVWIARLEGYLFTPWGVRQVGSCVGPAFAEHRDLLPVADVPGHVAELLELPSTSETVPLQIWRELFEAASVSEDDTFPGRAYALFNESGRAWPDSVPTRCRVGDTWSSEYPNNGIAVASVPSEYEELVREGIPALLAPTEESARIMVDEWGMLTPDQVLKREVRFVAQAEPVPLLELFPQLRFHRAAVGGMTLTRCAELEEITRTPTGMRTRTLERTVQDHSVLVLRPANDLAALTEVDAALRLGLGPDGCQQVMEHRRRQLEDDRLRKVRRATTEEAKILELVGEERLRAGLPAGLEELERSRTGAAPTGERLARLALNTHGEGILSHHAKDVAARHEAAPHTFTGTNVSRRFVTDLGLPESFAGSTPVTRPEVEEVDGPSELPLLHDYQETVAARMVDLLSQEEPGRAMLRLPTGAGKTRVAVEAILRLVHQREITGPILWIAQSDELCEQAVQSWRYLWAKVGPERTLTINRFWDGNDATPVSDTVQLVVATDATLYRRLDDDVYDWLRNPALVVIDEAHRAISKSYTAILDHLGLTRWRTARPLVGLTATPYRGLNEDETRRLVERFDQRRLDEGLFGNENHYVALQGLGVLAKVDHRELRGSTLTLTESERATVSQYHVLPSSAEEQLARDVERNETIIAEIAKLPSEWPVLVFATSVNHSKLLTAMLNDIGIPSTAIDNYTPMSERRRRIQEYREGKRRVITNYGVLAQGFDAPRTRAVVIARPTYSPNVYQQMIGRGLRGPLNGGEDTCLILDVQDNIVNYGAKLAFTGFEHLWKR
ncbi:hypothetical protein BJF90_07275 [Pseudonocardia sp. CNS-004]|nr:hypothetical protein BJF90_07275 [Pseudonocardia sp. CNS-004]